MALFNILGLTHWAAWGDFLLTRKHKYSLPSGGNHVVFGNLTGAIGKVVINGINLGGVDVAWTLILYFQGVTREWISSVFEMFDMFWIAESYSFSSWDDITVRVKLLVYDVWFEKDDNIGFLSVVLDIFDWLYFKERPISLPMVPMSI